MPINPVYMSFDHEYVETVTLPKALWGLEVPAYRLINRSGAYPVAGEYAAGVTIFDAFGERDLNFKGYGVRPEQLPLFTGSATFTYFDLDLEDLWNATTNPTGKVKPLVTDGVAPEPYLQDDIVFDSRTNDYYFLPAAVALSAAAVDLDIALAELIAGGAVLIPNLTEIYKGSSTTPHMPRTFKYQKYLSIVTNGIAIVEVDPTSAAIVVDDALYAGAANGLATKTAGAGIIAGRALDPVPTPAAGTFYTRMKIGAAR